MGFWIPFLVAVALQVVAYILTPKPQQPGVKPDEFSNVPTVQEGASIPVLFGTRTITSASVTWYGDLKTQAIKEDAGK